MKTLKLISMLLITSVMCFAFTSCSDDDDEPTKSGENKENTDYSKLIPGFWENVDVDQDYYPVTLTINYKGAGTISFYDLVNTEDGQSGVMAFGTQSVSGNKVTAIFNEVSVKDENWNSITYHGFKDKTPKTVVYTIQSCDGKKLVIKDDSGKTYNYKKYKDVK